MKKRVRKILGIVFCVLICFSAFIPAAFAANEEQEVVSAVSNIMSDIGQVINIATIGKVLGIVMLSVVGLFLFWWAARKVVGLLRKAFTGGKMSV